MNCIINFRVYEPIQLPCWGEMSRLKLMVRNNGELLGNEGDVIQEAHDSIR